MGKITWEIPEGVKKEDILTLDVVDSRGNVKKKTQKISEFFNHLVSYGGFCIEEGTIKIWGDYSIFVPINAFITLFDKMKEEIGEKETEEIFYWLGRMNGKNATEMLIKRFGANKKDIPLFVNGATQDGMGYLQIHEYDKKNFKYGVVVGTNSILAESHKKHNGVQKKQIDYYLAGILAGGVEPLINKDYEVEEIECVAKGDKKCTYYVREIKTPNKFSFFKKLKIKEEEILKKTRKIMLKRKSSFKLFGRKNITFGDGSFTIDGIKGIDLMNYGKVVLDKIIKELAPTKKEFIEKEFAKEYVNSIKNRISKKNLQEILKAIEIFGYGKFKILFSGSKRILISNKNNPYPRDYIEIFGKQKEGVDKFLCYFLEEIFRANNKQVKVKETKCASCGGGECVFEIQFI